MALLFCESFDHYASPSLKGWSGSVWDAIEAGQGRFGTYCAREKYGSFAADVSLSLGFNRATLIVGFAYKQEGFGYAKFPMRFFEGGTLHGQLFIDTAGNANLAHGNGSILASYFPGLVANTYYYWEIKYTPHDTAGAYEVRLNGNTIMSATNVDTRNGGTGVLNAIGMNHQVNDIQRGRWDDIYICDTLGGVNDDFLGDVRVEVILPSGNGNYSELVGQDADSVNNYLQVDEVQPDGDTTYVESPIVGAKDTYTYGNPATSSGTVYGVQILPYAKKTDAGVRSIASMARLSGVDEDGPTKTLNTDYAYLSDIREEKPGGGSWTITDVQDAEFGVKVTA